MQRFLVAYRESLINDRAQAGNVREETLIFPKHYGPEIRVSHLHDFRLIAHSQSLNQVAWILSSSSAFQFIQNVHVAVAAWRTASEVLANLFVPFWNWMFG